MKTLRDPAAHAEIRARLARLTPDAPRQWGRMNAHQMICHLADSFRGVLGHKTIRPLPTPVPRSFFKWVALRMPMHWPHGVKTVPEVDQEIGGTRPAEFAGDLRDLQALLARFVENPRAIAPRHPIFGPMSETDWMRWGYLHVDHHLRQFGN